MKCLLLSNGFWGFELKSFELRLDAVIVVYIAKFSANMIVRLTDGQIREWLHLWPCF